MAAPVDEDAKRQLSKRIILMSTLSQAAINTTERYRRLKDPVARHTAVLDKFLLLTDIAAAVFEAHMESSEWVGQLPEALRLKCLKAVTDVKEELTALSEWVQHPVYSPDHPVGNATMKTAAATFATSATESSPVLPLPSD